MARANKLYSTLEIALLLENTVTKLKATSYGSLDGERFFVAKVRAQQRRPLVVVPCVVRCVGGLYVVPSRFNASFLSKPLCAFFEVFALLRCLLCLRPRSGCFISQVACRSVLYRRCLILRAAVMLPGSAGGAGRLPAGTSPARTRQLLSYAYLIDTSSLHYTSSSALCHTTTRSDLGPARHCVLR